MLSHRVYAQHGITEKQSIATEAACFVLPSDQKPQLCCCNTCDECHVHLQHTVSAQSNQFSVKIFFSKTLFQQN